MSLYLVVVSVSVCWGCRPRPVRDPRPLPPSCATPYLPIYATRVSASSRSSEMGRRVGARQRGMLHVSVRQTRRGLGVEVHHMRRGMGWGGWGGGGGWRGGGRTCG